MRFVQIIIIAFVVLLFENCTSTANINGRYTNIYAGVAGEELRFDQQPNRFEYYSRTEGRIRDYSAGTWSLIKKAVLLNGFDDKNINVLNVETKIEDYPNDKRDKIVVQYKDDPLDTFTKVDIIVNENSKIRILGDTTLFSDAVIRKLQVKSYLIHEDVLLGTPPRIDTLYSPLIEVRDMNNQRKIILLKFDITQNAFYRIKLADTITAKNRKTLIWDKKEFKKLRE